MNKKQKIITGVVAGILILGGIGTGVAVDAHNKAEAQEKAKAEKAYDTKVSEAKAALKQAEKFKAHNDVDNAIAKITKLRKADQKAMLKTTDELDKLWKQVDNAVAGVLKAEKSKSDQDVTAAQKLLDGLKDKKQAEQKKLGQERLDKLKAAIKTSKDKANAEKSKAEEKANAEATAASSGQPAQTEVPATDVAAANPSYANQGQGGGYVPERGGQAPAQPAPQPTAPPATGGGNSGGSNWSPDNTQETQDQLNQNQEDALEGW